VLVIRDGLVLAVSRGLDTSDWGMPGGHVDGGETLREAASRELREETGVRVGLNAQLVPLMTARSQNHITSTYHVDGRLVWPSVLRSEPFEGYVAFKKPQELCTPQCSFAPYHADLFRHLGIY